MDHSLCEHHLPLEDNLRRSLAEDSKAGIVVQLNHGAHRLSHRVERVDLEQLFLGHLDPVIFVVQTEFDHEAEQRTFRLVANLLR